MKTNYRVVTVCYRVVRGKAKQYPYWGAKVYETAPRKSDGLLTFRPVEELGPNRRSERLAYQDAREYAKELGLPFIAGVRLGTPASVLVGNVIARLEDNESR